LLQDIVTASPKFSVEPLIPKLRDYMRVTNPYKRQFLISWITVLDSVPDLDLLAHLPQLLDGLLNLLSDPNREIRVAAHKCTMEFLVEIQATRTIDFVSLARILVDKASSPDEFTRMTAIKWLKEFVEMASGQLVGLYADMIGAVLPNISHPSKDIQQVGGGAAGVGRGHGAHRVVATFPGMTHTLSTLGCLHALPISCCCGDILTALTTLDTIQFLSCARLDVCRTMGRCTVQAVWPDVPICANTL
jgi:hypothetical protein